MLAVIYMDFYKTGHGETNNHTNQHNLSTPTRSPLCQWMFQCLINV